LHDTEMHLAVRVAYMHYAVIADTRRTLSQRIYCYSTTQADQSERPWWHNVNPPVMQTE